MINVFDSKETRAEKEKTKTTTTEGGVRKRNSLLAQTVPRSKTKRIPALLVIILILLVAQPPLWNKLVWVLEVARRVICRMLTDVDGGATRDVITRDITAAVRNDTREASGHRRVVAKHLLEDSDEVFELVDRIHGDLARGGKV